MNRSLTEQLEFDRLHLWHPYASIDRPLTTYMVQSAQGARLRLADGRSLIDGMASWWSVIHGYGHPRLVAALQEQASRLSHVMFGGLTHEPAIELGRRLVELAPAGLQRVFFADSGSVAVEVAMKMAVQYAHAQRQPEKKRFVALSGGYHGDTFHAMSVCDPKTGMHRLYRGILPQYFFVERPRVRFGEAWDESCCHELEELLERHHQEICAIILEPVVQGAGGMYFYHPRYLERVRQLCDHYRLLLIADEIATGFARTGTMFGCDHAGISPDICCLGKALTGGTMTLAAVLTTAQVGHVISSGEPGVLMHGPTFMANPLACAVASASIDLLLESDWRQTIAVIERALRAGLEPCRRLPGVAEVRVLGAIGVVELTEPVVMARIQPLFVEHGVWVRPFGRLVYVMPPYCIGEEELRSLTRAIVAVVSAETRR